MSITVQTRIDPEFGLLVEIYTELGFGLREDTVEELIDDLEDRYRVVIQKKVDGPTGERVVLLKIEQHDFKVLYDHSHGIEISSATAEGDELLREIGSHLEGAIEQQKATGP